MNRLSTAIFNLVMRTVRAQQRHRRSQFAALELQPGRVVFLGDSITEGGLWDEWFPHAAVVNRGIGGETSGDVLARIGTAVNAPAAVFLMIGTNDLSARIPLEQIEANVLAILREIEERAPGVPVHLQSVLPRKLSYRDRVKALNKCYQALADESSNVRYLDLWPHFATPEGALRPRFTLDHLHLNGEGYRCWADQLRPYIESGTASGQSRVAG
ncbi:GDSL-type esterase/lipase family protein [Streptodolium elevatio]